MTRIERFLIGFASGFVLFALILQTGAAVQKASERQTKTIETQMIDKFIVARCGSNPVTGITLSWGVQDASGGDVYDEVNVVYVDHIEVYRYPHVEPTVLDTGARNGKSSGTR